MSEGFCVKCKKSLGDSYFYTLNGNPCCDDCFEDNHAKCAFCGKKQAHLENFYSDENKPKIKSCYKCRSELGKPKDYDTNAIVKCSCGKTVVPKGNGNGDRGEEVLTTNIDCRDCKRERERERESKIRTIYLSSVPNALIL